MGFDMGSLSTLGNLAGMFGMGGQGSGGQSAQPGGSYWNQNPQYAGSQQGVEQGWSYLSKGFI